MAERLGICCSVYENYENGNCTPDFEMLVGISDILDCSLDDLFGRKRALSEKLPDTLHESEVSYEVSAKALRTGKNRRLAIGVENFRMLREQKAYYVDKTQMIEEFLESWYQVTLITRPRRFGKTLNMSMLAEFLDCTKDSGGIFKGTKISESKMMQKMNSHPVIFLSFLNVKAGSAAGMLYQLKNALQGEYERYYAVINDGTLSGTPKKIFNRNYECLWSEKDRKEIESGIVRAIPDLCRILEAYYGRKVYFILDEYDTPFISANSRGYYDEVRDVLAGMLSSSLKGNPSLERAVLTGIQRVAKENIFSGLNNLIVCTVKDSEYSGCFGFKEKEVRELLEYCGVEFSEDVRAMYDGYLFGDTEVYNPWSVSCYAARRKAESYWVNTSENSILKNALKQRGESFEKSYNELIENGTVNVNVELSTSYYEKASDASLWGLLINAGMLTIQEETGERRYKVRVPNQEVWKAFQELTAFYLQVEEGHIDMMLYHLRKESMEKFGEEYRQILLELPSYYDLKSENSYHMMMLGMCAFLQRDYEVKSNRESGNGRSDILLYAKKPGQPHMIMEFKYTNNESQNLGELALEAVRQVKEKKYGIGITGRVYYIGLAHYGKRAEVRWEFEKFY